MIGEQYRNVSLANLTSRGLLTLLQAHGHPFVVPTPGNRHVLVSSEKDIKELSEAPVDELSLHAVAKEVRRRPNPEDVKHVE